MKTRFYLLALAVLFGGLTQAHAQTPAPAPVPPVVFVVNGSGGGYELTNGLAKASARAGVKLCLDTVLWSRYQAAAKDHDDIVGHQLGAQQLVSRILALRAHQPGRRIEIVAFSSGTHVALLAAKCLPADSVDRIVLLAPSVAYFYDLTPALKASREGVDVFYSYQDIVLETATAVIGSADGYPAPAAGRFGFLRPCKTCPSYPLYVQKLRQYPWTPAVRWTGHCGGHLGWVEYGFLQAYVVPILG